MPGVITNLHRLSLLGDMPGNGGKYPDTTKSGASRR
jgi:hypothetical protein